MAVVLTVGNRVTMRIWCRDTDQASVNTLDYVVGAVGGSPATDQDVADQFSAYLDSFYSLALNNNAEYRGVQVTQRNGVTGVPNATVFNNNNHVSGVAGAVAMPRQTAGLISFQTNLAGRQYRGRCYIPFPSATSNELNGTPTAAYQTQLSNIAGAIGSGAGISVSGRTATLVRALFHRKPKSGVTPPSTPVINATYANRWATQRRRGSYGRLNISPI